MGREHRGEQHGCQRRQAEEQGGGDRAEAKGYQEGEQPEAESFFQVLFQVVHVNLDACEKHQVEDSDLPEHFETHVARQEVEPVGPHGDTGENQADDIGDFKPVEKQGGQQDYRHHHQENGDGSLDERRRGGYGDGQEIHGQDGISFTKLQKISHARRGRDKKIVPQPLL